MNAKGLFLCVFLLSLFGLVGVDGPPLDLDGRLDGVDSITSPSVGWLSNEIVSIVSLQPPIPPFAVSTAPQEDDSSKVTHGFGTEEAAPVASSLPRESKQDVNPLSATTPSPGHLITDPLDPIASATTSRGSASATGKKWSFVSVVKGGWKGFTVGPFRGYLGIFGIVNTKLDPATPAGAANLSDESFDLRLQEERRRQERRMKEQRAEIRRDERLRRRPKLLADRLAAQAQHDIAVRLHVKIMWNHARSRLNGQVRL